MKRPEFRLAVEQLSVALWRKRLAYHDLSEHGLMREGGKPVPLLAEVAKVENAILRRAWVDAAFVGALGLDLARGERELSVLEY